MTIITRSLAKPLTARIAVLCCGLFITIVIAIARAEDSTMMVRQLLAELEQVAATNLEPSQTVQQAFTDLRQSHGIADTPTMYRDFVRVRLAFEATRDAGLWGLKWAVTNREPNSDAIWRQWQTSSAITAHSEMTPPTAVAECDELSALFAVVARGLGVESVGLLWPTHNHTVAVWTAEDTDGNPVRVVVPTSQIFLSAHAGLGTTEFDPSVQQTIYDYTRQDIALDATLPINLAEWMIIQIKAFGALSAADLQARRNQRSTRFGGS